MDNYQIIEKNISNGKYNFTHKVLDKKENNFYIMKQILIDKVNKEDLILFKNEIHILSKINNKNVVKYYKCFIENNYFNIIMEFCENSNLRAFIKKHKEENRFINQDILYISNRRNFIRT